MVLPSFMRLRGYKCFNYLYKEGKRFYGSRMVLRVVKANPKLLKTKEYPSNKNSIKFAVSISQKVSKKAVIRNKLRRQLHEHLSKTLSKKIFIESNWAIVSLKPNCASENSIELRNEFDQLLYKSGLLK
tara:strand:- start:462 stop:848 length:387 start_codon:yes stop_codon:yes gene_type:complete